ncbi:MAG: hypothetical protein Fur0046_13710 [Cyanobacteria bacterium J069]|nr:MAG: hypothetical protein D6742_14985 [Cyanobacteria bacterium J069]
MDINQFVLEPTEDNLKRYERVKNGSRYWHTADFWLCDSRFESEFEDIFDVYLDLLMADDEADEATAAHKIGFSTGRMLVKAARASGISPRDYRDQFNNYTMVIWTPICIWTKDEAGYFNYSLRSNL